MEQKNFGKIIKYWIESSDEDFDTMIALFDNYSKEDLKDCYGICSDYILKYKE